MDSSDSSQMKEVGRSVLHSITPLFAISGKVPDLNRNMHPRHLMPPKLSAAGEASNGHEAVNQFKSLLPDIILMDISMPDLNGIEATAQVLALKPDTGIIMLTIVENNDSLFAAMRAGARGYILNRADKAEMLKTIRSVANGEAIFGQAIATRLTSFFQSFNQEVVPA